MARCYLSIGSNLGDRLAALTRAVEEISGRATLGPVSKVYETEPLIVTDQDPFLNICCRCETFEDPESFLRMIQRIEADHGRNRKTEVPKGPRALDIDILLWDGVVLETETLAIPHPGLLVRQFVLRPLLEIEPGLRDPRAGAPLKEAAAALPGQGVYCYGRAIVYSGGAGR